MASPNSSSAQSGERVRVAVVVSHPIQHFAPLYRELAQRPEIELKVYFCSRLGLDPYFDPGFGLAFKWETDLLAGYEHEFLANAESIEDFRFWTLRGSDIVERLDRFEPDVVQIYGYAQAVSLRVLGWCAWRRIPVLFMSDSELAHDRPLAVRAIKRLLIPPIYRLVSGFLTIGDNNERYVRHYGVGAARTFRSPYPTDDKHFLASLKDRVHLRERVRAKHQIPEAAFVAVFVGKLIPRKRPADVIDAVLIARRQTGVDIIGLLVGSGELEESLVTRASADAGAIRFAGFINQDELPGYYSAADVIMHPASIDPHPISVTEGVLMGLPAIVSDAIGSVGPSDTVRADQNGIVVECGNVPKLAAALARLATDGSLHAQMSAASRRIAGETGLQASVAGYVRAVTSLRSRHPTPGRASK